MSGSEYGPPVVNPVSGVPPLTLTIAASTWPLIIANADCAAPPAMIVAPKKWSGSSPCRVIT